MSQIKERGKKEGEMYTTHLLKKIVSQKKAGMHAKGDASVICVAFISKAKETS